MKNIRDILKYIISISCIFCCLLGSIHYCCFNEDFYTSQHDKILLYGKHINEHIGISNEDLKTLTSFTLDYLNDADASLDIKMNVNGVNREIYTDDEKLHMEDVRKLNLGANTLLVLSFILLSLCSLYYVVNKCSMFELYNTYKKVLYSFLTVFSIIGIWVLIDFDSFWTLFHKIFFAGNDLWLLDLRKDILIMIVPPEFFNHLVIRILVMFILLVVICYISLKYVARRRIRND